jgi:prepilin-type N-terminal cleavage/methylation domain-containing protein
MRSHRCLRSRAFTLIELLVVVAILVVTMSILLPSLGRARLKAKVVKAHAELRGICLALETYHQDYNAYPLAQSYCTGESYSMEQYFELPAELFEGKYLSGRFKKELGHDYAHFRDPFDPDGHSYKYIKPGVAWGNNHSLTRYQIWVPKAFPQDANEDIRYPTYKPNPSPNPQPWERFIVDEQSPVDYAVWSCGSAGPIGWQAFQESQTADPNATHLPVPSRNWHTRKGNGIICHLSTSKYSPMGEGHTITSP